MVMARSEIPFTTVLMFACSQLAMHGYALEHASMELRADREVVLAAVAQSGSALHYAASHGDDEQVDAQRLRVGCHDTPAISRPTDASPIGWRAERGDGGCCGAGAAVRGCCQDEVPRAARAGSEG